MHTLFKILVYILVTTILIKCLIDDSCKSLTVSGLENMTHCAHNNVNCIKNEGE